MDPRLVTKHRQSSIAGFAVAFAPSAFFLLALYLPLSVLILGNGILTHSPIPYDLVWAALRISLLQAAISTLLSGIIGTGLAVIYVDAGVRISRVFWNLSLICFSLPTLIVCLALISFWGKSGWMGSALDFTGIAFYGWFGVLCAHIFMNFSVFFRSVTERLFFEDRLLEKAALRLGASRTQTFRWVTWPKIAPAVRSSSLLVFVYCFTSFLSVLLLGGGPRFSTLEVLIYQAVRFDHEIPLATSLCLLQVVFCTGVFYLIRKVPAQTASGEPFDYRIYQCRTGISRWMVNIFLFLLLFFLVGPLAGLLIDGIATFGSVLNVEVMMVTLRGLGLAVCVGLASVTIGGLTSFSMFRGTSKGCRAFLKMSSSFPMVLSSIVLSMAAFQFFGGLTSFRETFAGPFLIQTLIAVPLVTRNVTNGLERIPLTLVNASKSLGASPWQTFSWVEFPLLKSALRLAFALSVCLSLGEVGSLLMFAVGGEGVLPLWIYRQMGRYHFKEAAAGSLLLVLVLLVFFKILSPKESRS